MKIATILLTIILTLFSFSTSFSNTNKSNFKNITFSFYSPSLHGSKTSDGGRYQRLASRGSFTRTYRSLSSKLRAQALTCASNLHKNGTILEIKAANSNKTILVLVTDKLAKRFTHKRIDLSEQAIKTLNSNYAKMGLVRGQYRVHTNK